MFKTIEVNPQPSYDRITLHMKDGVMVTNMGTRYIRIQVNWYFSNRITIEGMREGSKDWEKIQQLSLSRQYPSIDSRNLKSIYFQVYDDGSKYHFQAIVKMKNGLAKTLTLITWQQLSLSQQGFQSEGFNIVNDLNDAPFGLRSYAISYDSKNTQTAYGVVLTLGNSGAIGSTYWIFQLAFGTNGEVYHRSCINYKNNWTEWAII